MFPDSNRRQFLLQSVTGFSAAWISAQWPALVAAAEHARREARSTGPKKLEFFSSAEAIEIDAISSRVIPTDETPGAHEAGVVYFVDRALASFAADSQKIFRAGLPELQARVAE
ncbi:MAG TPA: gluconate 2-dehydrogenase subunit 3 family protein, partial [Verrucomicrobiae bacterium]|nr:gluconate 2-dehydrogenase subunit 3 family protein [Verrucomicrobiae bacterium]